MSEVHLPLGDGRFCLLDEADHWLVSKGRLSAMTGRYVRLRIKGQGQVFLHRFLTGAKRGQHVDHINGDGFDNRRSNLRICTPRQNQGNRRVSCNNTTGFKGVSPHRNKYRAQIGDGSGKQAYIGLFDTAEEAARAYDARAREFHGDFARLNFPVEQEFLRRASA